MYIVLVHYQKVLWDVEDFHRIPYDSHYLLPPPSFTLGGGLSFFVRRCDDVTFSFFPPFFHLDADGRLDR